MLKHVLTRKSPHDIIKMREYTSLCVLLSEYRGEIPGTTQRKDDIMDTPQEKVKELLEKETPKYKLQKWVKGWIPKHVKRYSCDMDEAIQLAARGVELAIGHFDTPTYFTQSLIIGAAFSDKYDHLVIVTGSQYGKSFILGMIGLIKAFQGDPTYVAGANNNTTEIIMQKVINHIQIADPEIQAKLIEAKDKIEKLQSSVSKKKLTFKGGGLIEGLSLGETFSDAKKGNNAIGRSGNFFIDEASMVSDDVYAELGRRQFSSDEGKPYLSIEISNPHNPGRFFDTITDPDLPDGTLVVWIDCLTALEEGRIKSPKQILESDFYKNRSTCTRYLLCELEDYSEDSMFPAPQIDNTPPSPYSTAFLGLDSAHKGADALRGTISAIDIDPHTNKPVIKLMHSQVFDTSNWVDGVTDTQLIEEMAVLITAFKIKRVCVDIGYGIWIVGQLIRRCPGVTVTGINFGSGTTKIRKQLKHYSAVYGENMRAELHLDMKNLMEESQVTMAEDVAEILKPELRAVKATRRPNGKTQIIAKKEIRKIIGHSPDTLDSALLAVHAAVLDSLGDETLIYSEGEGN